MSTRKPAAVPTVIAAGPVHSPLPMNPASRVYPVLNERILHLASGAWQHASPERYITTENDNGQD